MLLCRRLEQHRGARPLSEHRTKPLLRRGGPHLRLVAAKPLNGIYLRTRVAGVPTGAEVIDLGDATLLPGFIDAHTHITFEAHDDIRQDQLDRLKKGIPELTLESTEYARRTLLA